MPTNSQTGWRPLAFILAITALIYAPALRFGFVYDDPLQIINNPRLSSWSYVPSYFQHHIWIHISETGSYYRPLFLFFLRTVFAFFGSNAVLWHATAIVLHLAAVALVYALLRHTMPDTFSVVVATLIFALHPAHIESVAWISGLTDPLMTLPLIGSLLLWLRFREQKKIALLIAALLLFVTALMIKESAVVAPFLVFAYALSGDVREPFGARLQRALAECSVYIALFAAYWVVRIRILSKELAPPLRPGSAAFFNLPHLTWFYVKHLLWPANLSVIYDFDLVAGRAALLLLAFLILVFVMVLGVLAARRSTTLFLAWAWIFSGFALAIAATPTFDPHDYVHDRYLYLPALGLGIAVAALLRRLKVGLSFTLFDRSGAQVLASLLIVGSLAYGTESQLAPWAGNLTLFTHTVQSAPHNPLAYEHLAFELYRRGDTPTAIRLYEKSVALDPQDWRANFGLAVMLYRAQLWQAADDYCGHANQISPDANNACYQFQTIARMNLGRFSSAEAPIRYAIAHWPAAAGQHLLLGRILLEEGKPAEAVQQFQEELEIDPYSSDARTALDRISSPRQTR